MRVFVAGATGVLGRRVVARLVHAGHRVAGLCRREANADALRALGAEPREGELFDARSLARAADGSDAVLHLATAIPGPGRTTRADWASNDRIRRDGTRALTEAALAVGARTYVQQSVVFLYGDRRGAWVDERTEIAREQNPIIASSRDMEAIVRTAGARGLRAAVLRFGGFYGHDSAQTAQLIAMAHTGRLAVAGPGTFVNPVHLDDAADAVLAAVETRAEGLFNVCDDEPVTLHAWMSFLARLAGHSVVWPAPRWAMRVALGGAVADTLLASVRCRNTRAREILGWKPAFTTYRQGYRAVWEQLAAGR